MNLESYLELIKNLSFIIAISSIYFVLGGLICILLYNIKSFIKSIYVCIYTIFFIILLLLIFLDLILILSHPGFILSINIRDFILYKYNLQQNLIINILSNFIGFGVYFYIVYAIYKKAESIDY